MVLPANSSSLARRIATAAARAARNAGENAFLARQAARGFDGFLVGDDFYAVDQGKVQRVGMKASAETLNFVGARV